MFGKIGAVVSFLEANGLGLREILALVETAAADFAGGKAWGVIAADLLAKWQADQKKG